MKISINHTTEMSAVIDNYDVEDDMCMLYSSYLYSDKGEYNISVHMSNNVSTYVTAYIHPVLNEIRGEYSQYICTHVQ